MANDVQLKPGWLARDVLHAAHRVATEQRDAAYKKYQKAQQDMWSAEREWLETERRVQKAFVDLANGQGVDTK